MFSKLQLVVGSIRKLKRAWLVKLRYSLIVWIERSSHPKISIHLLSLNSTASLTKVYLQTGIIVWMVPSRYLCSRRIQYPRGRSSRQDNLWLEPKQIIWYRQEQLSWRIVRTTLLRTKISSGCPVSQWRLTVQRSLRNWYFIGRSRGAKVARKLLIIHSIVFWNWIRMMELHKIITLLIKVQVILTMPRASIISRPCRWLFTIAKTNYFWNKKQEELEFLV